MIIVISNPINCITLQYLLTQFSIADRIDEYNTYINYLYKYYVSIIVSYTPYKWSVVHVQYSVIEN